MLFSTSKVIEKKGIPNFLANSQYKTSHFNTFFNDTQIHESIVINNVEFKPINETVKQNYYENKINEKVREKEGESSCCFA